MGTVWKVVTRKKVFDNDAVENSKLARVLNTFDLTALGVGSTLGVGVYVIVGHVARDTAGPSVVLSFLIAAIASIFAGLCYAEFGARTPRAGSAYIYSYTCIGEFVAFIIGWNLILEYVIGSASVAKGLSLYLDTLLNDTFKNAFMDVAPIKVNYMAEYFDFFSFGIAILLSVGLAFGVRESSVVNNLLTAINILVVLFVIIAGSMTADASNWNIEPNEDTGAGDGGFFPFGITGMIKGAATCFYAFIGFDTIATTGEEVRNPKRAIPIAIIVSLLICFICYFSTATVVTMMVPFYAQDIHAPLPHAFVEVGWEWAKWVVAIGGMFGLCASLFGAMFPLPRILYAMASDGLIFRFLGIISSRFSAPVIGTLIAGILTGLMSALFDLAQLVNMMSIGTLLAYTIVAACVLLLRYTDSPRFETTLDEIASDEKSHKVNKSGILSNIFAYNQKRPTKSTEKLAAIYVTIYSLLALILGLLFLFAYSDLAAGEIYAIVVVAVVVFGMIAILLLLCLQPTTTRKLSFKVPLVPFIPAISILINLYLMLMLDAQTWIRFGVWMLIGIPMYIFLRLCCQSNQSTPVTKEMLNGDVTSNGHIVSDAPNGTISDGSLRYRYINGQPSAPLEEYSEDSGCASSVALESDVILSEEAPPETKPRKSLSISVDIVISALDNVIKDEETMQTTTAQLPERKISVDTVSNASCLPIEEKVVALVHRENEISEPTTPSANSAILLVPPPVTEKDDFTNDKKQNSLKNDTESLDSHPDGYINTIVNEAREDNENPSVTSETNNLGSADQNLMDHNTDLKSTNIFSNESTEIQDSVEDKAENNQLIIKSSSSNSDDSQPVSLEDLHNERNESDTDVIEETKPIIPIAPPMANFENFKLVQIPRVSLDKKHETVILRHKPTESPKTTPKSPELDYNARDSGIDEPGDDNMLFGTDRHKAFKNKLEKMLVSNNPLQQKLTKPEQHEMDLPKQSDTLKHKMSQLLGEIVRTSAIDNDSDKQSESPETGNEKVDDEFKGKLANILAGKSLKPIKVRQPIIDNNINKKNLEDAERRVKSSNGNDQEVHKGKMIDTLSRIKLRQVESFQEK
ncbi:Amino acid permease [Popillia japonica]|uniref:Amino acid permease n=1 Tax=Popillia japonica TaxID=7064 RepID=A0AAW1MEB7_POPJA